ncbi:MAG TPA: recombinase family protein [Candidatus Acidoferrales bacterium]|nr:recombinase family protein [Candidatus Acidoferrales bacterium]
MKAIGYARVSTEKQADFGVSLEAQAEKVRAMAVVQSAEPVDVIVDAGESACARGKRPWAWPCA